MSFLLVDHVHHIYLTKDSATVALEDIQLSIEEGEFVSFLGPSGCGKTTLLSIIAGLIKPIEGTVSIANKPITKPDELIGYMLQQDYLFPWKTIEENVTLGLKITNQKTPETTEKTLDLLRKMGLDSVEKQFPSQLSGGMRQRAALVRTLATNPQILLLDEPFSALDYQTKLKLEDLVVQTLKDFNKTAILVTHDIGEAIAMSDRIFVFSAKPGRINRTYLIPKEIRELPPFYARQHPKFSELFQQIWKELDQHETE
ncbi:ABC transporter ATP-binding protein [Metabacillus litoralis]|uniref:ABC transporter ATP-binding protein n=1 Tax=Metabacillus TaxID=2675233 RepID=UPI000EF5CACD|nr:ABC transporter ATP-binding protein [Metabacillus litoralis]MCM3164589.1 ABC transporter ATP-binding protein [Metabacillus litoralis]MCM3410901.1 ABC transporter ATP-binding protein [Metabacillus litoralis]UHA62128.1 ABC transporter ATP-binding protein [Metabacillus litoralis]